MDTTEIVPVASARFMPVMSIQDAIGRYNAFVEFTKALMTPGKDYGAIPGAGDKPTLLKPGAEKLCSFFGLSPEFVRQPDSIVDFERGMFYMHYCCALTRDGRIVATGLGSANSMEKKYRYRQQERTCPACGKATIIKGKQEYGGGWICFAKKGGCGAKYKDGDAAIESQTVGQIENPDPADLLNTLDKMAQKRALVAAVLIGANASEFYTQDIEDMEFVDAEFSVSRPAGPSQAAPRQPEQPASQAPAAPKPPAQAPAPKAPAQPAKPANGNGKRPDTEAPGADDWQMWFDLIELSTGKVSVEAVTAIDPPESASLGDLRKSYKALKDLIDAAGQPG